MHVFYEQPSRYEVFFHTGNGCQIFASGNMWVPGDTLIFKGFCYISLTPT